MITEKRAAAEARKWPIAPSVPVDSPIGFMQGRRLQLSQEGKALRDQAASQQLRDDTTRTRGTRNSEAHPSLPTQNSGTEKEFSIPLFGFETPESTQVQPREAGLTAWDSAILDSGFGIDSASSAGMERKTSDPLRWPSPGSSASTSPSTAVRRFVNHHSKGRAAVQLGSIENGSLPLGRRGQRGASASSQLIAIAETRSSYSTTPTASSPEVSMPFPHLSSFSASSPEQRSTPHLSASPMMSFREMSSLPALTHSRVSGYSQPAFPYPESSSSMSNSPVTSLQGRKESMRNKVTALNIAIADGRQSYSQKSSHPSNPESTHTSDPNATSCPNTPKSQQTIDTSTPNVKLADLGNAIRYSEAKRRSALPEFVCTRQYRPPENIIGAPWDNSVDIWATACVVSTSFSG